MAIIIRQSESEVKLAFEVHRHAEIARVRLASAKLRGDDFQDAPERKIQVRFAFNSAQRASPPATLRIEVTFRMEGLLKREMAKGKRKGKAAVLVECVFEADYDLHPDLQLTPEHVKAFREGNAIFNLWPYFREFLQSHMIAMALPPLTAPFLRVQPEVPSAPTRKRAAARNSSSRS